MSTKVIYKGSTLANLQGGEVTKLNLKDKKLTGDIMIATEEETSGSSNLPPEIATQEEMTALLDTAEVGSVFKYVGTTDAYENGALYIVEESE